LKKIRDGRDNRDNRDMKKSADTGFFLESLMSLPSLVGLFT
jgi:hypothetical protein